MCKSSPEGRWMAETKVGKTLYLTINEGNTDGSGDIHVPPPMFLLSIPMDYTGKVSLNFVKGKLSNVQKNWNEIYKPVELTSRGFQRHP